MAGPYSVLLPDEAWLIGRISRGETADFNQRDAALGAHRQRPQIGAYVIRNLLLGLTLVSEDDDGTKKSGRVKLPSGVRAAGFDLIGPLDLDDATNSKGRDLPALILNDVWFKDGEISARHVRFTRLVVRNSRFTKLNLEDSHIFGDLDLSGSQPTVSGGDCCILGHGVRVDGSIRIIGGHLKHSPRPNRLENEISEYALDLLEAKIQGSLILEPNFKAMGGVRFGGARIGGWVQLAGANLDAVEGYALHANGSTVGGTIKLSSWKDAQDKIWPFVSNGKIYLQGAIVGGSIVIERAILNAIERAGVVGSDEALDCANASFDLNLSIDAKLNGNADLKGIKIKGKLEIIQLHFSSPPVGSGTGYFKIDLSDAEIYKIKASRPYADPSDKNKAIGAEIQLNRARCTVLDDNHSKGWGNDVRLLLDGFEYTHFNDFTDPPTHIIPLKGWKKFANLITFGHTNRRRKRTAVGRDRADWINGQVARLKWWRRLASFTFEWIKHIQSWLNFVFGFIVEQTTSQKNKHYRPVRATKVQNTFSPQPYAQLVKVLESMGALHDAAEVHRKRAGREARNIRLPFRWLYRMFFGGIYGYGTRPGRAVVSLLVLLSFGWWATTTAQTLGLLVIDTQPTTTHALLDSNGKSAGTVTHTLPDPEYLPDDPVRRHEANLQCSTEITPWLFAIDRAVPLIELREQGRCYIRPPISTDGLWPSIWTKTFWVHPTTWRYGMGFYTLLGWLMSSLTILTVTGVYRRYAARDT
jgi:hypothetical protein